MIRWKIDPVVVVVAGEEDEVVDRLRRLGGVELQREVALVRLDLRRVGLRGVDAHLGRTVEGGRLRRAAVGVRAGRRALGGGSGGGGSGGVTDGGRVGRCGRGGAVRRGGRSSSPPPMAKMPPTTPAMRANANTMLTTCRRRAVASEAFRACLGAGAVEFLLAGAFVGSHRAGTLPTVASRPTTEVHAA